MKKTLIGLLVAFAICSCTKDSPTDDDSGKIKENEIACVTASISAIKDSDGKNETIQKLWTVGSSISVVGPHTNQEYKFDGESAKKSGTFTSSATYTPLALELESYYALAYGEFKADADLGLRCYSSESTCTQKYSSKSVGSDLLFATSEDGVNYTFSTIVGYLRVPLVGDNVVKSIELINNENVYMSGYYYIEAGNPKQVFLNSNKERKTSIMLDCGDGVQLMEEPTYFYFAIKPMELKKGVTLNVTFADGTSSTHGISKALTIKQNGVLTTSQVSITSGETQILGIKYTGKTFIIPTIVGSKLLSGYINFGDGEHKTLNSIEKYDYTDGETSHDISFSLRNATGVEINGCKGITELDFSNF